MTVLYVPSSLGLTRGGWGQARKVDVRLPGKGNSDSHGARPVHLIITMIKRIRTSRLSIKNSLFGGRTKNASTIDPRLAFASERRGNTLKGVMYIYIIHISSKDFYLKAKTRIWS